MLGGAKLFRLFKFYEWRTECWASQQIEIYNVRVLADLLEGLRFKLRF